MLPLCSRGPLSETRLTDRAKHYSLKLLLNFFYETHTNLNGTENSRLYRDNRAEFTQADLTQGRVDPHTLPFLTGSVELPKTTHLPKTTENHLENHIHGGIIHS